MGIENYGMKTLGFSSKQISAFVAFVIHLLTVNLLAGAPDFRWAQSAGGEGRDYATGISVDPAGNSYVVGRFTSSSATFGSFTVTNGGLFIAKYGTDGNVLWARQFRTSATLRRYGITAGQSGDCYVGGSFFAGAITFGNVTLTNGALNHHELFLARYDNEGNLAWARKAGPNSVTNELRGLVLATDSTGNCYFAGDYFKADFGVTNLVATNSAHFFTARFDTNGNLAWISSTPTSDNLSGLALTDSIRLLTSGGYIIGGEFSSTFTLGDVVLTNASSDVRSDLFLAKFDSFGRLLWAKRGGGTDWDYWCGTEVDASGNAYLAGIISGSVGSGPASFDNCVVTNESQSVPFLVKYDPDGNVLWCKKVADFVKNLFALGWVEKLTADAAGNVYLTGRFLGTASFDGITLTNRGGDGYNVGDFPSYFLAKLDSDGRTVWAKDFGGAEQDDGSDPLDERKNGIAVDAAGNCSIAGFVSRTNMPFDGFTLSTTGEYDLFVARLDADPPKLDIAVEGHSVTLSWLTNQPNFVLESSTNLLLGNAWSSVTDSFATSDIRYFVTDAITADSRFFRLHSQ